MTPHMRQVIAALEGKRYPLATEKMLQAAMEIDLIRRFEIDGQPCAVNQGFVCRELPIVGGVIDFLVIDHPGPGATGIEVKIKGHARDIAKQIERYAAEPMLAGIVVASAKALRLPAEIGGKPVVVVDLGRAWL